MRERSQNTALIAFGVIALLAVVLVVGGYFVLSKADELIFGEDSKQIQATIQQAPEGVFDDEPAAKDDE